MAPTPARAAPVEAGLAGLRRPGTVTELLFLFDCLTTEPTQLRPVAERLGLTVQAASHTFRGLARRGLAEVRDGRYRATVRGVDWLHRTLGDVTADLQGRLDRMHVIRSTRALAEVALDAGVGVSLRVVDGLLHARPGLDGASRGRTAGRAAAGELVEVVALEGIVPLARGPVRVLTVPGDALARPGTVGRLRARIGAGTDGLLAAPGLEGYHLLRQATGRPILRFGVAAACLEASRVGVASTVVVLEGELARFLGPFEGPDPPPLSVEPLFGAVRRGPHRARGATP